MIQGASAASDPMVSFGFQGLMVKSHVQRFGNGRHKAHPNQHEPTCTPQHNIGIRNSNAWAYFSSLPKGSCTFSLCVPDFTGLS